MRAKRRRRDGRSDGQPAQARLASGFHATEQRAPAWRRLLVRIWVRSTRRAAIAFMVAACGAARALWRPSGTRRRRGASRRRASGRSGEQSASASASSAREEPVLTGFELTPTAPLDDRGQRCDPADVWPSAYAHPMPATASMATTIASASSPRQPRRLDCCYRTRPG